MVCSKKRTDACSKRPLTSKAAGVIVVAAVLAWAPGLHAQQKDRPNDQRQWVREFESVEVKQIKPDDLPKTTEPGASTGIRTDSDELPKPASRDELEEVVGQLKERVVRVVVVQTPPQPYRQVPTVHFGHALWVNPPEGEAPRLITPLSWLKEADQVFVIPAKVAKTSRDQDAWRDVHRRSLESVTAGRDGRKWLDEHEDDLVAVAAERPDEHRNLVTLAADDDELAAPSSGIEIFDVENKAMFRVYGYTPFFGDSLVATKLLPNHPEEVSLAFYWQTSFPAILGAPLVSEKGELVALNTFRHPKEEDIFLAIPTGAIASYLSPASP